jgi:hypothetical protein
MGFDMNIVLGDSHINEITEKSVILELDSFRINGGKDAVRAWCVLENISIQDFKDLDSLKELHHNLIKNYRLKNWNYCRQALEHLQGRWNQQVDTFYFDLATRITDLETQNLDDTWDGVIEKNI